jgi:hypothetical protein
MYTGIICACLPSLKAFAKHYFPNMFGGHNRLEPAPPGENYYTNITPKLENGEQHRRVEVWEGGNGSTSSSVPLKQQLSNPSIRTEDLGQKTSMASSVTPLQRQENALVTGGTRTMVMDQVEE